MSFPYTNSLADVTASFPSSVYSPLEFKNLNDDGYTVTDESVTVPASPDGDGKYRVNLNYQVLEQATFNATQAGNALTPIPYGETVSSGEVGLDCAAGILEFHSSLAGLTVLVDYVGRGTPIMGHFFNSVGKEVQAVENYLTYSAPRVLATSGLISFATTATGTLWTCSDSGYYGIITAILFRPLAITNCLTGPYFSIGINSSDYDNILPIIELPITATGYVFQTGLAGVYKYVSNGDIVKIKITTAPTWSSGTIYTGYFDIIGYRKAV